MSFNNPKRLLMIAYYFPPLGGAGVQRSAKFAKYLARQGWQVEVISVQPPSFEPVDPSLESEINCESIKVRRLPYREQFRAWDRCPGGWRVRGLLQEWFLFPDRASGWYQPALAAGQQFYAQNSGWPVFTTSAPYTSHLIGLELKRKYGVPWIADFRDEWSQNPYLKFPSPYHRHKHLKAERAVLTEADGIISVTQEITNGLRKLAPASTAFFETIPNGYDPEDFGGLTVEPFLEFTITHVGTINQSRAELLKPFLAAARALIANGSIPQAKVKLKLIGAVNPMGLGLVGEDWVQSIPYLPHHEALQAMASSDLLLLAEANPSAYTGKVFEYLGLRRPILGLVHPQSPAAELIRAAKAGWVAELNSTAGLAKILLDSYRAWEEGKVIFSPQETVIAKFNRQSQAARLADLITGSCTGA